MVRVLPTSSSKQGFSLLELMIVIVVMGIITAMIAPGLNEFMADGRHSAAAEQLLRLHRSVRARVSETGLAHLVRFDSAASGGRGAMQVFEGMNNHCITTPWNDAVVNGAANNHFVVDSYDMDDFNKGAHRVVLTASTAAAGAVAALDLCFQPNGMVYRRNSAGATWTFISLPEPVLFTITRTVDSVGRGVPRQVIFPIGGNARLRI
jgi:prepilin-type N-terminal cleavage/methylation domain-containing protein